MQGHLANIFRSQRSSTPTINSKRLAKLEPKGFKIETCSSSSYKKFKKFNIPDSSLTYIHKLTKTSEKQISMKSSHPKPEDQQIKFLPSIKLAEILKQQVPQLSRLQNTKIFDYFPSQGPKLAERLKNFSHKFPDPTLKSPITQPKVHQCKGCSSSRHSCKKLSQNVEIQSEPFELSGWETDLNDLE
jgi:hypothetical protein